MQCFKSYSVKPYWNIIVLSYMLTFMAQQPSSGLGRPVFMFPGHTQLYTTQLDTTQLDTHTHTHTRAL